MPYPLADRLIYGVTDSHLDHVAICLPRLEYPGTDVYEAQPPRCRKMTTVDYEEQVLAWSKGREKWRHRTGSYLQCYLMRSSQEMSNDKLLLMQGEAERWLGVRYSMVFNYLFDLKTIHCSELVGRCLFAADIIRDWGVVPSKITPVMVRDRLRDLGWQQLEYVI